MSSEILTLQFGHYSNFVGTHWWNIQESTFKYDPNESSEIDHDVLYREGCTEKGEVTFTPRLLLVDYHDALGTLSRRGNLYESNYLASKESALDSIKSEIEWNNVEVVKEEAGASNDYLTDLERGELVSDSSSERKYNFEYFVRVWSDFLYARFHPRTVNVIKQYSHSKESLFNLFPVGHDLWNTYQFEQFGDRIRNYLEECNSFQGFHILLDGTNAFAGLAAACIEHIVDEYGKPIFALPVIPTSYYDDKHLHVDEKKTAAFYDIERTLNLGMCFDVLQQHTNIFAPLSTGSLGWRKPGPSREFYHTTFDQDLHYHTSAFLASALDTFSMKYRLKKNHTTLYDLISELTGYNRKAVGASLCLPFSLNADADLIDCLDAWEGPLSQSITPNFTIGTDRTTQLYTVRGIPIERLKKPPKSAGKQLNMEAYKCNTVEEMMKLYLSCSFDESQHHVLSVEEALPVKQPFPQIFDPYVGVDGFIRGTPRAEDIGVEKVPVVAGLHNGYQVGVMLESLLDEISQLKFPKFVQFLDAGVEMDMLHECIERLLTFRECYHDNVMF